LSRPEKCRRLITRRRTGVSATVADRGPPSRRLISPKNSPGVQQHVLVGRHLGSSRAVNDQEKLIARLTGTGQQGAGGHVEHPCDPGDASELAIGAPGRPSSSTPSSVAWA
jgi:hypothetical protein